ncbi:DUF2683 family protein [Aquiflexum sp.]|uniref:DUF2683 family protein n=1 Tax=Aquiflexum sp. TaxID=1872584 RepID=UPI0035934EF4
MKTKKFIIIHPETTEQENELKAFAKALKMKFEVAMEYDPEFVAEIDESREQYKKGEFISVNKKNIKSYLGLK